MVASSASIEKPAALIKVMASSLDHAVTPKPCGPYRSVPSIQNDIRSGHLGIGYPVLARRDQSRNVRPLRFWYRDFHRDSSSKSGVRLGNREQTARAKRLVYQVF